MLKGHLAEGCGPSVHQAKLFSQPLCLAGNHTETNHWFFSQPLPTDRRQDHPVRPRFLLVLHSALPLTLRPHLEEVPHLLRGNLQKRFEEVSPEALCK